MATALPDSYGVASGEIVYGGRYKPGPFGTMLLDDMVFSGAFGSNLSRLNGSFTLDDATLSGTFTGFVTPAWLAGQPTFTWIEIASAAGNNNAQVDAFSGGIMLPDGRMYIAAAGGHGDSSDNRVVSIDWTQDTPSWTTVLAASGSVQTNVRYYTPDLRPTSRHTYTNGFYVPSIDRLMYVGLTYAYGDGNSYAAIDGFHVSTGTWDAGGTYIDIPEGDNSGKRGVVFDGTYIWTNTLWRYNPATNTGSYPITTRISPYPETPWAYDSTRSQLFGLMHDGTNYRASKVPTAGSTEIAITLNSVGGALATFMAEAPSNASLQYDPRNDQFLFYSGIGSAAGRVYAIKPTSGTTWDISILSISGTPPGATVAAGINSRFLYSSKLNCVFVQPQRTASWFAFRVA